MGDLLAFPAVVPRPGSNIGDRWEHATKGSTVLTDYDQALTRRRLSPQTIKLRLFYMLKLEASLGDLTTATTEELEKWLADREPRWSLNTQQTAIAAIRSFYKWATESGRIRENPAAEIVRVRVHRTPSRRATEAEIRDGLDQATLEEKAMILLGAECGFRVSEIAALHRDNRRGKWLTIVGKGNVQRTVAASPELQDILDEIEQTTMRWKFYFPGRSGGHAHPSMIWRHIQRCVGVNPHALRHRAGTVVFKRTRNIRTAQVFLGHANSHTTEIYLHVDEEDLEAASAASRIAA